MTDYAEVPESIVRKVRAACGHLPEAYEEPAFAGVRWRIRGRTLAHLVTIDDGTDLTTLVWFHAAREDLEALLAIGDPFSPGWGDGLVTMSLTDDTTTDWDEVNELLTDSYRILAPRKLVARLDTPNSDGQ